jgi:hypothetical protein
MWPPSVSEHELFRDLAACPDQIASSTIARSSRSDVLIRLSARADTRIATNRDPP